MQIYADVTGRSMKIAKSEQTPALGAAIFGAVSAGKKASGFDNIKQAQAVMTGISKVFEPDRKNFKIYQELYKIYSKLHDSFGTISFTDNMYDVMKDLLSIRDKSRMMK